MRTLPLILIIFILLGCSASRYTRTADADGGTHCKDLKTGQYVEYKKCN